MNFTASIIAEFLKGTVEGDPDAVVNDVAKIEEGHAGALSFLANPKYEKYIYDSQSSIIIVNKDFEAQKPVKATLIRVDNAYESFAALLNLYEQNKPKRSGISPQAAIHEEAVVGEDAYIGEFVVISKGAEIGKNASIYPQVYIGDNVTIGENVTLYPGVKIMHDCVIGSNCIFHAGVVIGGDGFGFVPDENNVYSKVPQLGNVVIEDNVEIGANTTIDRATMGSTIIRKGVKLDNLIMVAHNVEIGKNTVVAGQSGMAGTTKIGDDCQLAGQVGLGGHLTIANKVKIGAQSGIISNIRQEGAVLMGSPAIEVSNFFKSSAAFKRLPDMRQQIFDLVKKVDELQKDQSS